MSILQITSLLLLFYISLFSQKIEFIGEPELFAPGIVSAGSSEIKITFSNDGKLVLWGSIGRENGIGGFDIWQAEKCDSGWSNPRPSSFNSSENDFDPSFSADGKLLYFFSNREGGMGKDDIYFVKYDSLNMSFGEPINMGENINTEGDEWGPIESIDGMKFIYCTDGLGGKGRHDIFICERTNNTWGHPTRIESINSEEDDFDPILLNDCKTLLFTRKINDEEAYLFISYYSDKGYSKPIMLDNKINILGTWNFGSSIGPNDPSYFYYSTHNESNTQGRLDIFRVGYIVKDKE